MTAKRFFLFVLGLCALTLLGGVAAANLSILALGNTEGALFFFLLGCGVAVAIGLGLSFLYARRVVNVSREPK